MPNPVEAKPSMPSSGSGDAVFGSALAPAALPWLELWSEAAAPDCGVVLLCELAPGVELWSLCGTADVEPAAEPELEPVAAPGVAVALGSVALGVVVLGVAAFGFAVWSLCGVVEVEPAAAPLVPVVLLAGVCEFMSGEVVDCGVVLLEPAAAPLVPVVLWLLVAGLCEFISGEVVDCGVDDCGVVLVEPAAVPELLWFASLLGMVEVLLGEVVLGFAVPDCGVAVFWLSVVPVAGAVLVCPSGEVVVVWLGCCALWASPGATAVPEVCAAVPPCCPPLVDPAVPCASIMPVPRITLAVSINSFRIIFFLRCRGSVDAADQTPSSLDGCHQREKMGDGGREMAHSRCYSRFPAQMEDSYSGFLDIGGREITKNQQWWFDLRLASRAADRALRPATLSACAPAQ
jgi:hypothetical protein